MGLRTRSQNTSFPVLPSQRGADVSTAQGTRTKAMETAKQAVAVARNTFESVRSAVSTHAVSLVERQTRHQLVKQGDAALLTERWDAAFDAYGQALKRGGAPADKMATFARFAFAAERADKETDDGKPLAPLLVAEGLAALDAAKVDHGEAFETFQALKAYQLSNDDNDRDAIAILQRITASPLPPSASPTQVNLRVTALNWLGASASNVNDFVLADRVYADAQALAERLGATIPLGTTVLNVATDILARSAEAPVLGVPQVDVRGRLDVAEVFAKRGLRAATAADSDTIVSNWRTAPSRDNESYALATLGRIDLQRVEHGLANDPLSTLKEACAQLKDARNIAYEIDALWNVSSISSDRARVETEWARHEPENAQQHVKSAVEFAEAALREAGSSEDRQAEAYEALGRAHAAGGDVQAFVDAFSRAIEHYGEDVDLARQALQQLEDALSASGASKRYENTIASLDRRFSSSKTL